MTVIFMRWDWVYSAWSNVIKVTRLDVGSNCFVFKHGIRPEWEDPINENGGKFSVQFQRTKQMGESLNQLWLHAVSDDNSYLTRPSPGFLTPVFLIFSDPCLYW